MFTAIKRASLLCVSEEQYSTAFWRHIMYVEKQERQKFWWILDDSILE